LKLTMFFPRPSGAALYRLIQPLKQIQKHHHVSLLDPERHVTKKEDASYFAFNILGSDIMFVGYTDLIANEVYDCLMPVNDVERKELGHKVNWWVDCDDSIFGISPYNIGYKDWGLMNFRIIMPSEKEIKWLWKDKEYCEGVPSKDFSISRNKQNVKRIIKLFKKANVVTTTTEAMRKQLLKYNKNVVVTPNAIDMTIFNASKRQRKLDGYFRIGWTFSPSHFPDWFDIRKTLEKFMADNKDCKLVMFSQEKFGSDIPDDQIEHYGWTNSHNEYANNMLESGVDVAICPLSDHKFNYFKSPLKWLEWGSIKIPSIVSKVMYNNHVKHRTDALVYKTQADLYNQLTELKNNAELTKTIGENAYNRIKCEYDIEVVKDKYLQIINDLKTEV